MPQNFIPCDRDQSMLMPPNLREWLPEDHLVYFVIDAVKQLDLGAFYRRHRPDGWGRAAYDPAMMVTLLLYAYAIGVRSARDIERRTVEDVAFRIITANRRIDHATICRFIVRHRGALSKLFVRVLGLCADAGMVRPGVVAIDGTKIEANASATRNITRDQLEDFARKVFDEADRINAEEDALYGDKRGDEIPEHLIDQAARIEWLRSKLAEQDAAGTGTGRRSRKTARVNTTDPDSAVQKTPQGYTQGYNGQFAVTEDQVVVAVGLTADNNDHAQLKPMIAQAQDNLDAVSAAPIGTVVADAGYFNEHNARLDVGPELLVTPVSIHRLGDAIANRVAPQDPGAHAHVASEDVGVDRRTQTRAAVMAAYLDRHVTAAEAADALGVSVRSIHQLAWYYRRTGHLRAPRVLAPSHGPNAKQIMLERFAQPGATAIYGLRARTAEPVIGQLKQARGLRRFLHRGAEACLCELEMMAAAHNLRKAWVFTSKGVGRLMDLLFCWFSLRPAL